MEVQEPSTKTFRIQIFLFHCNIWIIHTHTHKNLTYKREKYENWTHLIYNHLIPKVLDCQDSNTN